MRISRLDKWLGIVLAACTIMPVSASNQSTAIAVSDRSPTQSASFSPYDLSVDAKQWKDGSEFIDTIFKAADSLNLYGLRYSVTVEKNGQLNKEEGNFYFKKPRLIRVEVTSGAKKGSVAVLAPDGKIHGHMGGLLKFFSGTVSADSPLAQAANGYPMAQSDFMSLYAYLKNMLKNGDRSRVTTEPVEVSRLQQKAYVLDMYRTKAANVTLIKRIYIDPQSRLPLMWEDYTDGRLDTLSFWYNVDTNVVLNDSKFRI